MSILSLGDSPFAPRLIPHGSPCFTWKIASFDEKNSDEDWVIHWKSGNVQLINSLVFLGSFTFFIDQTVILASDSKSWDIWHRSHCYYQGYKIRWMICLLMFHLVIDIMISGLWVEGDVFCFLQRTHPQISSRDDMMPRRINADGRYINPAPRDPKSKFEIRSQDK